MKFKHSSTYVLCAMHNQARLTKVLVLLTMIAILLFSVCIANLNYAQADYFSDDIQNVESQDNASGEGWVLDEPTGTLTITGKVPKYDQDKAPWNKAGHRQNIKNVVTEIGSFFEANCFYAFYNCSNLESVDLSNLNTSNITDMSYMFYECQNLSTITFGNNFDTSSVVDMQYMFYDCGNLTTIDLSMFNTDKVIDMHDMFSLEKCSGTPRSLEKLDLSSFNTKNVTDMHYMFSKCEKLSNLTLGENFDTSNVTNMEKMFYYCENLTDLDFNNFNFNTENVKSMKEMFNTCKNLINLDLGTNFDTSKATNMSSMFTGCEKLVNLNLGDKFETAQLTGDIGFSNCKHLKYIKFIPSKCTHVCVKLFKNVYEDPWKNALTEEVYADAAAMKEVANYVLLTWKLKETQLITAPEITVLATYGDKLSEIIIDDTNAKVVDKEHQKKLEGTFTWVNSNIIPKVKDAADIGYDALFTPADDKYEPLVFSIKFVLSPKEAWITANYASKTYGDKDPELSASFYGFINDDFPIKYFDYVIFRSPGENVGDYFVSIVLTNFSEVLDNYDCKILPGLYFKINPKEAWIIADSISKTYGDKDPELTASYFGFIDGDTPVKGIDYFITRNEGEEVGDYEINVELNTEQYSNAASDLLKNYECHTQGSIFTINRGIAPDPSIDPGADPQNYIVATGDNSMCYLIFAFCVFGLAVFALIKFKKN